MGGILSVSRFRPSSYVLGGVRIGYRLRRPRFVESADIQEAVAGALSAAGGVDRESLAGLAPEQVQAQLRGLYSALRPDLIARVFSQFVDQVESLQSEGDDGEMRAATSGADLLDAADEGLVIHVLMELWGMSRLSPAAGKASGSPSTSSPVEATAVGDSVAPSTDVEGGPAL